MIRVVVDPIHSADTDEALRCIRCGLCSYTCPTYRVLRSQAQSPRGRVALLHALRRGDPGIADSMADQIYRCTLCGACAQACPGAVPMDELLDEARRELAARDRLPVGLEQLGQTVRQSHNLTGEDNTLRLAWTGNLARLPGGVARQQAELVYFVGCVASFYPRSYGVPQAMARILDAAGAHYALLGGGEWCCGLPLLANGQRAAAREAMEHNVERVRAAGARRVVFTCPSCYHAWKHDYPALMGSAVDDLEVLHASELLAGLIEQQRFPLKRVSQLVTYHDPCDLARKGSVADAPRRVLRSIPGLELREMKDTRENALCCGGGGNLETLDPGLVQAAAGRRLVQAMATGAATIVSACQQCERTLAAAVRRERARLRVADLTEIVAAAVV